MNDDFLKNLPPLSVRIDKGIKGPTVDPLEHLLGTRRDLAKEQERKYFEEKEYRRESLDVLKKIESNTGDISFIVDLLQSLKNNQEEVLEVLKEIQRIGISKSEEEADSRYREVMKKITELQEDADTIGKLSDYSKTAWLLVKAYIKVRFNAGE